MVVDRRPQRSSTNQGRSKRQGNQAPSRNRSRPWVNEKKNEKMRLVSLAGVALRASRASRRAAGRQRLGAVGWCGVAGPQVCCSLHPRAADRRGSAGRRLGGGGGGAGGGPGLSLVVSSEVGRSGAAVHVAPPSGHASGTRTAVAPGRLASPA